MLFPASNLLNPPDLVVNEKRKTDVKKENFLRKYFTIFIFVSDLLFKGAVPKCFLCLWKLVLPH